MQNTCHLFYTDIAHVLMLLRTVFIVIAGLVLAKITSHASRKLLNKYATSHQSMIVQKILFFSILILFFVAALQQLGFNLGVLLGSAGIATAAIAIASQTAISNIISGFFLILEKSFQVGDCIKIDNTQGEILSIDLLSIKILTANHTLVRIPNEVILKADITNLSRFEISRLNLLLPIERSYKIDETKQHILDLAKKINLVAEFPEPTISTLGFDADTIKLQLSVWSAQKNFNTLTTMLYDEIIISFLNSRKSD